MAQYQTGQLKYLVSFTFTVQYDRSASQSKMKCRAAYYQAFNTQPKPY